MAPMDGGLGEAMMSTAGPVPELSVVVQFLAANAGLIVMIVMTGLLLVMILAELFLARRRQGSTEPRP
jgi:hypothetical protein